jgi:hypothetical protein
MPPHSTLLDNDEDLPMVGALTGAAVQALRPYRTELSCAARDVPLAACAATARTGPLSQ